MARLAKLPKCITILAVVISSTVVSAFLRGHETAQADDGVTLPWTIEDKRTTQQGQSPDYQIVIDQPVLVSSIGRVESFNNAVDEFVKESITSFMSMRVSNQPIIPLPTEMAVEPDKLTISYEVLAYSDGIIGVQLTEEVAPALSANYTIYHKSINYQIVNGKPLQIQDLFKSGTSYLEDMSNYVSAELKREDRLEFPDNVLVNLKLNPVWNLVTGGVLITFDQDTVSRHPLGPSTVFVPFTALPDDFSEDWANLSWQ